MNRRNLIPLLALLLASCGGPPKDPPHITRYPDGSWWVPPGEGLGPPLSEIIRGVTATEVCDAIHDPAYVGHLRGLHCWKRGSEPAIISSEAKRKP